MTEQNKKVNTMKKYELTDETKLYKGRTLHHIVAIRSFGDISKGRKGGWIEKEENLSHEGNCWVYDNAYVYDDAEIRNNARIFNKAQIFDNAVVFNNALIFDNTKIYGSALVGGNTKTKGNTEISGFVDVSGNIQIINAKISSNKDCIIFRNWWSSGRYFTWTRSNNMWSVGCFYGTGEELIKKAYEDGEDKGKHYEEIVEYVNKCVLKEEYYKKKN